MSRIRKRFEKLKIAGKRGFIPFISAGDPDIETSEKLVLTLAECGADVIELGVPFSDPMADGPVIQASSQRALLHNVDLKKIFAMVKNVRLRSDVPIVLFSYINPLFRYGYERLAKDAAEAGIDGVLVTDAVDQEAGEIADILRDKGIDLISLIAPTSSDERLEKIAAKASGFIYAVSRAGVTGTQQETSSTAEELVNRMRQYTDLPIAVGFGISKREHILDVWRYADAAVVGSAIVAEIEHHNASPSIEDHIRGFVTELLPQVANKTSEI